MTLRTLLRRGAWAAGSLLAVLALALVASPPLRADAAVFNTQLSGGGSYIVHSEATLVSGTAGSYHHEIRVRLANGSIQVLAENRTYLVGSIEVSTFTASGPVMGFLSEEFDPLF